MEIRIPWKTKQITKYMENFIEINSREYLKVNTGNYLSSTGLSIIGFNSDDL